MCNKDRLYNGKKGWRTRVGEAKIKISRMVRVSQNLKGLKNSNRCGRWEGGTTHLHWFLHSNGLRDHPLEPSSSRGTTHSLMCRVGFNLLTTLVESFLT